MLPSNIYDGCPSPGEREIFARLKNDRDIDSWTILHSLDLADHVRQVSGEADFVIIVPGLGVLCLEVKASHSVVRSDDGWYYGKDRVPHSKGPFRQASEAMHSIRNRVISSRPRLSSVLFWSAVIFPYLEFSIRSTEWHEWQAIDSRKMQSRGLAESIMHVLRCAREHISTKSGSLSRLLLEPRPSIGEASEIADLLRPSFELTTSPRSRVKRIKDELIAFTAEQYAALDALHTNDRILFRGPAGTGKTLLAIEAARRASKSGKKVLLICFNRLLREWISEQFEGVGPSVTVHTLHSYALSVAGIVPSADQVPSSEFWRDELPSLALAALLTSDKESLPRFDELVVDEAQDILIAQYLDLLDFSISKGLDGARWRFFADFENQAIFNSGTATELITELREYAPAFVEFSLRNNCRNPPRIACLAHLLGRLMPDYTRVLRPDNGVEPEIVFYRDLPHQAELLVSKLQQFQEEGFEAADTMVLSSRGDSTSAAATISDQKWKQRIKPLSACKRGEIGFASIHAFKGLEALVVIVTDLSRLDPVSTADLFYIGVTRAVERLVVLMSEDARQD
jgi:hypothetical protein